MSKYDSMKYEPTLVYTSLIKAIAEVRKYGADKYGSTEDWRTTPPTNHFNAMERHINAHLDGEMYDQESGLLHLAHLASTVMFEIERLDSARMSPMDSDIEVEIKCPRCKSSDLYNLKGIHPCTNACRYVIDPLLLGK